MKKKNSKRTACRIATCLLAGSLALILSASGSAAGNGQKNLKLGTSFSVAKKNATYKSSNEDIAYVNSEGIVTGKKRGKATIRITNGNQVTKQKVNVVANGKKKNGVGVCTGEMVITKNDIIYSKINTEDSENQSEVAANYRYSATLTIKNCGKKAASKVTIDAKIAGKTVVFSFGKINAGETATATAEGDVSQTALLAQKQQNTSANSFTEELSCQKLEVYSQNMYTAYDYTNKKTTYHWGTADTTAPVITGFVGKNSYNQKMPYQVVYSNDKHHDYFKYVKASDDREGDVKLSVDTKKVNFKKAGIYQITYTAKDAAGNVKHAKSRIEVRKSKQADEIADEVLSDIVKKNWSVKKKAIAIYNYTRRHISYVGTSNKSNWEREAVNGIRYGRGDCFTYYAVARLLLTRAGIPNIEVTRYRGRGHHWWNMVYVEGGWYHYDCGPRVGGGRFCLLTDSQLTQYSQTHGNKYIWNYKKIPKSPKKKLSKVF